MAFIAPGSDERLTSFISIWGHILLWSVMSSSLVYLVMGSLWVTLLKVGHKKWHFKFGAGVLFVLSALWKMISKDAILSLAVAGIYSAIDVPLAGEWALLWGVGLSLITIAINVFIACCPIYSVL
ncbi:PREDICTED: transmembrane protein 170B-like [Amphimedon queenslandica]|uniref:Uncharacterized protein n=1 Tax=Amphimedon queenslandica TaxID=400682 RepID=A0A1X7UG24_AMPQE|nr:PREDICTED: transmembrane protein 170B-like [Amphimedon queenslandica]|eukprot:XP_019854604.1 PREDICTED: transmembrane protein 170B-like [Amphimedon queenslandica]